MLFQQKEQEIKDLVTVYLTNFYKKYFQNLKYNVKRACIFHLILVGVLSIFMILSVKNMGCGFFAHRHRAKSVKHDISCLLTVPKQLRKQDDGAAIFNKKKIVYS